MESAVTALQAQNPASASSSTLRRDHARVAAVSGMAANPAPSAHRVTNCPAQASDTPRPRAICGSRPAGTASFAVAMKLVRVSASSAAQGSRVAASGSEERSLRRDAAPMARVMSDASCVCGVLASQDGSGQCVTALQL